ncbi:hypothetical protein CKAH01_07333 [Colletotrichum kahawae]|uniref:Uncharacterized protein n=1 Tax=Colletotrichum kahawae TaxID=34407 RepID=A0AAE0D1Z6_COLKA|nr:hypothetical protein CKAH01_07333 [Colletotrichum kahawae]
MVDDAFSRHPNLSKGLRRYLAVRKLSGLMNPGLQARNKPEVVNPGHPLMKNNLDVVNSGHPLMKNNPDVVKKNPDVVKNPRLQGRDNIDVVTCGVVGAKIYLKPSEYHRSDDPLADYWVINLPSDDLEEGVPEDLLDGNDSPQPEPDEVPNEFWTTQDGVPKLTWVSGKRYAWFFGGLRKLQDKKFSSRKAKRFQMMWDENYRPGGA